VIKIDKGQIIKKWIPIVIVISIIVITIGLIFGSSFSQIILSIVVSLLLILSAMFFRYLGGNRGSEKNNVDTNKFDNDIK
jgi:Sec-independent protein secretion pathway component TatC